MPKESSQFCYIAASMSNTPMRIFVIEMAGNEPATSHEFSQPTIKIGRDPERCDVVFQQEKWLMVSRLHAELRFDNARWYLIDLNSRQGTLLNGEKITRPTEVAPGARIQFGQSGPVVALSTAPALTEANQTKVAETTKAQAAEAAAKSVVQGAGPMLVLKSGIPARGQNNFPLQSERTVLGRDNEVDVQVQAEAQVVSRQHAAIQKQKDGSFVIMDLQSFNGTLVNNQRITTPTLLHNGDLIQLSSNGPVLLFVAQQPLPDNKPTSLIGFESTASPGGTTNVLPVVETPTDFSRTIMSRSVIAGTPVDVTGTNGHLLVRRGFNQNGQLSIGRAPDNDIQLDALVISNHHARFLNTAEGVVVQDAGSTNGVYLNGARIVGWRPVKSEDIVHIGPFVLTADPRSGIAVFDNRARTRVDAVGITDVIRRRGREIKLLDDVGLAIEPNEFVGLLGPSGAGKTLLMNALNGMRQTSSGRVYLNHLDLYQHLPSLKQAIGHVPQDDIIHRELTTYRTLYYVARLRLSRDAHIADINQIINEVLEVTGLSERRDTPVAQLSGGQRKRVSIAVELITKPSIIFLDEPTSGLDPATEERIMKLFRQIAESGRTIVLTTHAMENVHLFDKVAVLMRGRLIFYGTPAGALEFAGARNFIELYNKLDEPLELTQDKPQASPQSIQRQEVDAHRNQVADEAAEEWRRRFRLTDAYRSNIAEPLSKVGEVGDVVPAVQRRPGLLGSIRQWGTLVRRYAQVLLSDKINLLILFGQAPVIALLTYLVVSKEDPRDFVYFVLALVPIWFGTSVAAREIVKERSIYQRERMVNLGLIPYLGSKLFPLSVIITLQCVMLFGTLKLFNLAGAMSLPGYVGGLGQFVVMVATGVVGIAIGLFISAVVRTSEIATSIVPLLLIPQILLCGLVGVPRGAARVIGATMPATWAFDGIKRLSALDTLRQEGSNPTGANQGHGLYKHTEEINKRNIKQTREQIEEQQAATEKDLKDYERRLKEFLKTNGSTHTASGPPPLPKLKQPPSVPEVTEVSEDLSDYVSFKHPWGGIFLDFSLLIVMFFIFTVITVIALRARDASQ